MSTRCGNTALAPPEIVLVECYSADSTLVSRKKRREVHVFLLNGMESAFPVLELDDHHVEEETKTQAHHSMLQVHEHMAQCIRFAITCH